MILLRLLLVALGIQVVGVGYLAVRQLSRPVPRLPDISATDPYLMEDLQRLAEAVPTGGIPAWMELGQALLGQGYYPHAELCFQYVTRKQPENRLALASLAFCQQRTGRTAESLATYAELLSDWKAETSEEQTERATYLYDMGRSYLRQENATSAEELFRANPDLIPARYQLAKLLVRSERAEEALPIIEGVLARRPESLKFRDLQYRAYLTLGREEEADVAAQLLERSRHVVPLNPGMDFVEQYHIRFGMNQRIEEFNELAATDDMDRIADRLEELLSHERSRRTPHDSIFYFRLLEVELTRERPDRMQAILQELRSLGEQNAELLRYEGEMHALRGELEAAVASWQRVVRMDPFNEDAHLRLAEHFQQVGDEAGQNRHRAALLRIQAEELFHSNQLPAARQAVQAALELNPEDSRALHYQHLIETAPPLPTP